MKKILITLLIGILIGGIIFFLVNRQWPLNHFFGGRDTGISDSYSSDDPGFSSVTSKLDKGGDIFLYLGTEKIMNAVVKWMETLKGTVMSSEDMTGEQKADAEKWINFAGSALNESGLFEISSVGLSSKEYDKGLSRSKFIVQHRPGSGKGLIWNITGRAPSDMRFLHILPENTVFSSFSDFNYFKLWSWIKEQAERSGDEKIRFAVGSVENDLKNKGIDLQGILRSLNGDTGMIITFDRKNMKKIPVADKTIEFPDPGFALVMETSDEKLFNFLASVIPGSAVKEEKEGARSISIQAPPAPVTLAPVIIQKQGLMIFASNPSLAEMMLNGNKEKTIKNSEEFIRLTKGMPEKGNGFTFMSSSFIREIMSFQKQTAAATGNTEKQNMDILKNMGLDLDNISVFRITSHTKEGYEITWNTTMKTEMMIMLPVIAAGGMMAAIAIPAAIKKRAEETNRTEL